MDTGACSSVCRPESPNAVEELYTVDDTPLKACGEIRPQLRLGDKLKEEAQVTFQVVDERKRPVSQQGIGHGSQCPL